MKGSSATSELIRSHRGSNCKSSSSDQDDGWRSSPAGWTGHFIFITSSAFAERNCSSRRLPDRTLRFERVRYERTGGLYQASGVAQRFPVRLLPGAVFYLDSDCLSRSIWFLHLVPR